MMFTFTAKEKNRNSDLIFALTELSRKHHILIRAEGGITDCKAANLKALRYQYHDGELYPVNFHLADFFHPAMDAQRTRRLSPEKQKRLDALSEDLMKLSKQHEFVVLGGFEIFFFKKDTRRLKNFVYQDNLDRSELEPLNWDLEAAE